MSEFKVSDSIKGYHSNDIIKDAESILKQLVGKTASEIEIICYVARKIANENAKL